MLTRLHKLWILIFILSVTLWFFWATQYLLVSKTNDRSLINLTSIREILISIKENQLLKFKINELQGLLQNKQNLKEKNSYLEKQYNEFLEKSAYTDIDWEWLEIILSWKVNVTILIDLIHTFWFWWVKAISLNNIRINSNSFLSLINDEILLNWISINNPIKISAIWDIEELKKYLFQPDWIIKHLKNKGITVEAEFFDVLRINK